MSVTSLKHAAATAGQEGQLNKSQKSVADVGFCCPCMLVLLLKFCSTESQVARSMLTESFGYSALAASVAALPAFGRVGAAKADDSQGAASSRMSYSRFLEYLDMGRVKKVSAQATLLAHGVAGNNRCIW